jgi:hypothetical protein
MNFDIRSYQPIDCDIHPAVPGFGALLPFLDDYWREAVRTRGIDLLNLDLTSYPPTAPLSGRQAGIALDHAVLHFDGAAHGVDHTAELDENAVAGALDDAAAMHRDGGVDQIAAQRPQPRQGAILVGAGSIPRCRRPESPPACGPRSCFPSNERYHTEGTSAIRVADRVHKIV